ncbi:MAG: hypothetical protein V1802_02365 [Candidatus Aenigmatarchaeota archaeon]
MKGVSLAIETIVFIIIAVTVMSSLLVYFRMISIPTEDFTKLTERQAVYCSAYARFDGSCDGLTADKKGEAEETLKGLADTCKRLADANKGGGYPQCKGKTTLDPTKIGDINCIRSCCSMYCMR